MDLLPALLILMLNMDVYGSSPLFGKSHALHRRHNSVNNSVITRHGANAWMRAPRQHLDLFRKSSEPDPLTRLFRDSIDGNTSDWQKRRPPINRGLHSLRLLSQRRSASITEISTIKAVKAMHANPAKTPVKRRP